MTDIYAILSGIGLTIPEDKKADFDKAVRENYKTVAEVGKIETARDNYKTQLDEVSGKLKAFEGVDVNDLKGQIATLKNDLEKNDKAHKEELDNLDFNAEIEKAVKAAKGKNVKAVSAFLDLDTLRQSKNRSADIEKAVSDVKEANDYLFDGDKPSPTITVPGGARPPVTDESAYLDSFYKGNPFYKN